MAIMCGGQLLDAPMALATATASELAAATALADHNKVALESGSDTHEDANSGLAALISTASVISALLDLHTAVDL